MYTLSSLFVLAYFLVYVAALPADAIASRRDASAFGTTRDGCTAWRNYLEPGNSLDVEVCNMQGYTDQKCQDRTIAVVACLANDVYLNFDIEIEKGGRDRSCRDVKVLVNSDSLDEKNGPFNKYPNDPGKTLLVQESFSTEGPKTNSLFVSAERVCFDSGLQQEGQHDLGITSILIENVNDEPLREPVGFAFLFDGSSKRIISSLPRPDSTLLDFLNDALENYPHASTIGLPVDLVSFADLSPEPVQTDNNYVTIEEQLTELHGLRELVQAQGKLIEKLKEQASDPKACENIKHFLSHLYGKMKDCAEAVYDNIKSATTSIKTSQVENIATGGERPFRVVDFSSMTSMEDYEVNFDDATRFTRSRLLVAFGIIASLLSFGCLTFCIRRRCCSPRARAERAARREERSTARAYRRLARRHAWKDWWSKQKSRFGCGCGEPRSGDYEEKRALIRGQESVLEEAMQQEIRRLEERYGVDRQGSSAAAAEEGRSQPLTRTSSGSDEVLPAYRSRSGSGRPPSYRSYDPHASTTTGGFSSYVPSDVALPQDDLDATPDSSVANISPRLSAETLRTERSFC